MKKPRKQALRGMASYFQRIDTKYALLAVAGVVLVGGSFALSSGAISVSGNALLAQVYSAITGRPMLIISRDAGSPAGAVSTGIPNTLAIFDVSVKNVTHFATIHSAPIQVNITQSQKSPISLTGIALRYNYCIPVGATYGYGYKSSGCGTTTLMPSSVSANATGYQLNFYGGIPIYPQQYSGTVTVIATPAYSYTANATSAEARNATLQAQISGINASGDQCLWTYGYINLTHTYGYSYTGCVAYQATPSVTTAYGNTLLAIRPYGYGYNARTTTTPPSTGTSTPDDPATQQKIAQLRAYIAVLLQQLVTLLQARRGQ